jgi:DNA-binding transcriptional LysR family regulator
VPHQESYVNGIPLTTVTSDTYEVLNLRQMQCFVYAVDAGTMTAAAERLRVSQSAVSLAIAGLEHSLGAQLLIRRRSQGLALTEAGRQLLPQARELLAHAEDVRADVDAAGRALEGRLVVGCFRTAAPFVLPGLLETFTERYPLVQLDFIEGPLPDLELALLEGRCEVALVYDLDVSAGITCEPLYTTEPYALFAPDHTLATADRVAIQDLAAHDLVLLDVPPSRHYLTAVFEDAGVTPQIRFVVSGYELLRSLVARNLGYALLISRPYGDVSYEGRPLVARRLADEPLPIDVSLAWAAGVRRTRRARAFAEHCRQMLPDRLGHGVGAVRRVATPPPAFA